MALFTKDQIEAALRRLGELAHARGFEADLFAVGGTVMVLRYDARASTKDVDVRIVSPEREQMVRDLVPVVAAEMDLPEDWLNDGAKGYIERVDGGSTLFQSQGIVVRAPAPEHMLALKLMAWRDDTDYADAFVFLRELPSEKREVWALVEPLLIEAYAQKASYAFEELWEVANGSR